MRIPTVLLLTRFHFCPIQMFQEMIIRKLTPHIICSIDARSASSSAYRIRGSPLPTAWRQSVIDRTENWQNDQQMSLCHAQKVLCRGLSAFWTNILRGHSLFQQPGNQRYAKTAAHLTCLEKERMCGTFCNNLIYKNVFSSARPK